MPSIKSHMVKKVVANKYTIVEYENRFDAGASILSGLLYFLIHNTKVTVLVLSFMLGGPAYGVIWYFTHDHSSVDDVMPLTASKPHSENFSLMPQAYAQQVPQGTPIVIKGQQWGYADTTFGIWKEYGEASIIVYNKTTGAIFRAGVPVLGDKSRMEKYKK